MTVPVTPGPPLRRTTLEGTLVRLEPLEPRHAQLLAGPLADEEIWRLLVEDGSTPEKLAGFVARALDSEKTGGSLPFATVVRETDEAVGTTRFHAYEPAHRRVEIGYTVIARRWQRTGVNTEAKLLMLEHAFETLGVRRVELKTDALNARSRNAILRLGATEEGTLRQHTVTSRGRVRDSVYFSILADEWPAVRDRLRAKLADYARR